MARACQSISCIPRRSIVLPHHQSFELPPRPRLRPRPVRPKSTPLLRIQEPAIVERRGGQPINFTTSSKIANRVDRSTRREPSAFERNTSYTMGSHFDFRDAGANKSNARDILT